MKKFMLLYMSPMSAEERMANKNPDEMKKMMEPWMAWKEKVGSALVDFGTPLLNGMHMTKDGSSKTSVQTTGYSVVQAENMEALKAMLSTHPYMMMPDSSVEVFEMMPMNM